MTKIYSGKYKFLGTLKICFMLFLARTFGEYQHTIWKTSFGGYAVYEFRGHTYFIPITRVKN